MRNVLTFKEKMYLAKILEQSYTASGKDINVYCAALNANDEFKQAIPGGVTRYHVRNMLKELGTANNVVRVSAAQREDCTLLTTRVEALEAQLEKLTAYISANLPPKKK
jgi:fructose-1-phosphate kinase PfkB-like protein